MCMTSRAAQYCLAGRMRPVGHRLESYNIHNIQCIIWEMAIKKKLTNKQRKQSALCLPDFVIQMTSAHLQIFADQCGPRNTIPIKTSYRRDHCKPVKGTVPYQPTLIPS